MSARRPLNVAGVLLSELPADYSIPQDGVNAPAGGLSLRRSRPRRRLFWKGERSDGSGRPAAGARGALHQPRKPKCAAHRVRAAVQRAGSGPCMGHAVLQSEALVQRHLWDISKAHGFYGPRLCGTRQRPGPRRERRLCTYLVRICTAPSARQQRKAPLVFYFHGIGCVPLYGAEQSGWHDIADRENFIVVYPKPARNKAWNIWDEPACPATRPFVLRCWSI